MTPDNEYMSHEELFINKGLAMVPIPVGNLQFKGDKVKELLRNYSKEMAMGFYRFTEWKEENAHWFNQEGEIIDIEDVWNQYLQFLKSKKIKPEE